jgi:hypothetical protein
LISVRHPLGEEVDARLRPRTLASWRRRRHDCTSDAANAVVDRGRVGFVALLGLLGKVIGEQFGNWVITKNVNPSHAVSICLAGKGWSMTLNPELPAGNHVEKHKSGTKAYARRQRLIGLRKETRSKWDPRQ